MNTDDIKYQVIEINNKKYYLMIMIDNTVGNMLILKYEKNIDFTDVMAITDNRYDKRIVGILELGPTFHNHCEVKNLFVCESYRGQGFAKILIKLIKEWGRRKSLDYLEINPFTTDDNDGGKLNQFQLECFYNKMGFIKVGAGKLKYYYKDSSLKE